MGIQVVDDQEGFCRLNNRSLYYFFLFKLLKFNWL